MKRILLLTAGLITLASLAVGVMHAAQPKLTWSPTGVYAGITSTTTVTKTVTFTSDQALQNVSLEAVPEIARFVNIQPVTFAQVPAGQPQTIRLAFSAPAGAQFGTFEGTIHVRDGNATRPQTLKASITFAVVSLPPDPGEAGKTTLAGIDSDGDGVRDDVQRWIVLKYESSAKMRTALTQYTKATQAAILNSSDPALMIRVGRAQYCSNRTEYVLNMPRGVYVYRTLLGQVLNTYARARAFYTADANSSGHFSGLPQPGHELDACDVNPNLLPN